MPNPPTDCLRVAHAIEGVTTKAGGPTTAFLAVIDALAAQPDAEIRAFAAKPPQDDPIHQRLAAAPEGRFTLTPPVGTLTPGGLADALIPEIRAKRFDVLHLHGLWCRDFIPIAREAERAGVTLAFQPHGMLIDVALAQSKLKKQVFLAAGMRRRLARADLVIAATQHELDASWIPSDGSRRPATRAIPLPVEAPPDDADTLRVDGRRRLEVGEDAPLVVFLGRLHHVKRLELLIDAVAAAQSRPTLALIGEGEAAYTDELRARAEAAGLDGRLRTPGWLNGRDKWAALAAADAVVLCSIHENFGYTVPEAAAVGAAGVLTSNLSLAGELDAAGVGFVADSTPASLAGALDRAVGSRSSEARDARRAWVNGAFSAEAVGAALVRAYRDCRPG